MARHEGERAQPRRGHRPPRPPGVRRPPVGDPSPETNVGRDRGQVIGDGLRVSAVWAGRFIVIVIALAVCLWLLGRVWVGVLPVLLALILTTILHPPAAWLRRRGLPPAAAAGAVLLTFLAVVLGVLASIAPSIVEQMGEVVDSAGDGVTEVRDWLAGPPINLDNAQIDRAVEEATGWLEGQSSGIASGLFSGAATVGALLVTIALVVVLTFFFLKDGERFLPWVRRVSGRGAGRHLTEVLTRVWRTLGGFIRTQAVVSATDAVFIGLGLVLLGVPLALALAVLTFFAGFVPIVGAVTAGALAVLVALVSNGWAVALGVLAVVLAVQQLEGNVLQPVLQSRSMQLHAGVILLSVAAAGTLFGIPGAFLAVPVAASVVVVFRYLSEQVDLRTGDLTPPDLPVATPEGAVAARQGAGAPSTVNPESPESPEAETEPEAETDVVRGTMDAAEADGPSPAVPRRWWRRAGGRAVGSGR